MMPQTAPVTDPATVPPAIRELLVCPKCRGPLRDASARSAPAIAGVAGVAGLDCAVCSLRYPVRDGIPVMLIDQATPLGGGAVE